MDTLMTFAIVAFLVSLVLAVALGITAKRSDEDHQRQALEVFRRRKAEDEERWQ
jgi:hypothetical protein